MADVKASTMALVGQRFGMLTAVALVPHKGRTEMLCRCDCGVEKVICIRRLVPHARSCGCLNRAKMVPAGTVLGSWTIGSYEQDTTGRYGFRCKCTCGVESFVEGSALRSGRSTMCRTCSDTMRARPNTQSNNVWHLYRIRAQKQNIPFDLTPEQFRDIIIRDCVYCGSPPQSVERPNTSYGRDFYHNGVDRRDRDQGYALSNCVPCCGTCNYMKGVQSVQDFLSWADRVVARVPNPQVYPLSIKQALLIASGYRSRAKRKGLAYTLTTQEALALFQSACGYCGSEPCNNQAMSYYTRKKGRPAERFLFTGIDRIRSTGGYTPENSFPACWTCNNAKGNHSREVFLTHVQGIVAHQTDLISRR